MTRSLDRKYTREDKIKWRPPHPDLWSPKLWKPNDKHKAGRVMVHRPQTYKFGYWEEQGDDRARGKDYFNLFVPDRSKFYLILSIDKLQIRHLSHLGPAYDGERELCWMPWILDYIKEQFDEIRERDD